MSDQQSVPSATIAEGVIAGDRWVSVPRERIRESLQELKGQGFRRSETENVDSGEADNGRHAITIPVKFVEG